MRPVKEDVSGRNKILALRGNFFRESFLKRGSSRLKRGIRWGLYHSLETSRHRRFAFGVETRVSSRITLKAWHGKVGKRDIILRTRRVSRYDCLYASWDETASLAGFPGDSEGASDPIYAPFTGFESGIFDKSLWFIGEIIVNHNSAGRLFGQLFLRVGGDEKLRSLAYFRCFKPKLGVTKS